MEKVWCPVFLSAFLLVKYVYVIWQVPNVEIGINWVLSHWSELKGETSSWATTSNNTNYFLRKRQSFSDPNKICSLNLESGVNNTQEHLLSKKLQESKEYIPSEFWEPFSNYLYFFIFFPSVLSHFLPVSSLFVYPARMCNLIPGFAFLFKFRRD